MRKAEFAESILLLTTTPDRAAATAGDLTEESAQRGNLWFWTSLIRTTASLAWRSWTAAPLQITGLAVKAWLIQVGLFLGISIPAGIILGVLVVWGAASADIYRTGISLVIISIAVMACDFLIGRWMGRRAPGREIAGWVSYIVLTGLFWRVLIPSITFQDPGTYPALLDPVLAVGETLSFFAGVQRARRSTPGQPTSDKRFEVGH